MNPADDLTWNPACEHLETVTTAEIAISYPTLHVYCRRCERLLTSHVAPGRNVVLVGL